MTLESKDLSQPMRIHSLRDPSNSLDLRIGKQQSGEGPIDRWIAFSNGRTEWIEKYVDLGRDLRIGKQTGFLTWDHRGQGASGGARAWIHDYETYCLDMAHIISTQIGAKPYNLICHSMGGLIAIDALTRGLIRPRCVVLSSPLLGLRMSP